MKLIIGEFEVEVKAKIRGVSKRNNVLDTLNLLNQMSIAFDEAAINYNRDGYHALSDECKRKGADIYNALEKAGAYKDL